MEIELTESGLDSYLSLVPASLNGLVGLDHATHAVVLEGRQQIGAHILFLYAHIVGLVRAGPRHLTHHRSRLAEPLRRRENACSRVPKEK